MKRKVNMMNRLFIAVMSGCGSEFDDEPLEELDPVLTQSLSPTPWGRLGGENSCLADQLYLTRMANRAVANRALMIFVFVERGNHTASRSAL